MKQSEIAITSSVQIVNGVPRLFINEKMSIGDSYICYYTENNDYQNFINIGYKLYSIPVFFAKRTINETTQFPPFKDGMFEKDSKGLSIFDEEMEMIISKDPDALVFPRIQLSLPKDWDDENLDELNDQGFAGHVRRPCFSSDIYFAKVKEYLKIFIEYVQNSKYAKNIVGYQFADGTTQEWMPTDINGSIGKRSRERFALEVAKGNYEDNVYEYRSFLADILASRICEIADYIKELTENRLIVGAFYGYTNTLVSWKYASNALNKVLGCKNLDFLSSPAAYFCDRSPFEDLPSMHPVASLNLHGKLFFMEDDLRTDLSGFGCDLPVYQTPIWQGPNREFSLEMYKTAFASTLTRSHTYWIFDMWGKWFVHDDYRNLFKKFLSVSENALNDDLNSCAELAILIDEKAYPLIEDETLPTYICRNTFKTIGKSGVMYDFYLASDFEQIKDKYKAFILLKPIETKWYKTVENWCQKNNVSFLIINENNYAISTQELRDFYRKSGIFVRFDDDIVVYENKSYIAFHAVKDITINEDKKMTLTPLLEDIKFPVKAIKGHTYLFKKN